MEAIVEEVMPHSFCTAARFAMILAAAALAAGCQKNFTAYALTSTGSILEFQTKSPQTISNSVTVSGLNTGESILQFSYQPSSGTLFCITNDGFLCTVDPGSGIAALVGTTPFTENLGNGDDTVTLTNPVISFDPVGGDLRVINADYNLLVNPGTGLLDSSNTEVGYASGDTNNGKTPDLGGIAYSNPVEGAASTTLYGLDVATDSLVQIGNGDVNSPTSVDTGSMTTIGSLGLAISQAIGFTVDQKDGIGYASLQDGSGATLYTVDLSSGALTSLGLIGDGTQTVDALVIIPGD
jgi:hypothetical protein